MKNNLWAVVVIICFTVLHFEALGQGTRNFSGTVVTRQFELVPGVVIEVKTADKTLITTTDSQGHFSLQVPSGDITAVFSGKNLKTVTQRFAASERIGDVQIRIEYVVPPISASVTITADALEPDVEQRNDAVYKNSLFNRDDQLVYTLNAGINAGQHEGGGKSLEIRRFGYNLDHGGVNGGLKVMVDDVQQNQGTQGHGQGYLGALKSLSPELVEDVSIVNGPFSAAYGDFSGLGVVQIHLRESLPQIFTMRLQGGAYNMGRGFFAYSPEFKKIKAFIAYEPSYTDGPWKNKGRYRRDNVSGNFDYAFDDKRSLGAKFNFGRNNFYSSGQIPLDEVNAGRLDRFGFIDPHNGGRVRLGTGSVYFKNEFADGSAFKADTFVGRSLFDLFSNFTFFALDPIYGDEIQQHDSRLQEGGNVQYLKPYKFSNVASLLTIGGGIHLNQINVGLYPSIARDPSRKFRPENIDNPDVLYTSAKADVNNYSGYIQNSFGFFDGHVRLDAGLRYDYFSFKVNGFEFSDERADLNGKQSSGKLQPKLALAVSPFDKMPITFYANYGRGIASQDARGVIRDPDSPKVTTTDFYQAGASYNGKRFSGIVSTFLIDNSNQQVYIPDDGSLEFAGRSRSYGVELRNSIRINNYLSFNAGLTQVIKAYYPGQFTFDGRRVVVDSAPHTAANGGFVLSDLKGFSGSLSWRNVSHYRLDGEDPTITAAGLDVVDLSVTKRLRHWIDVNFSIDNLLDKKYYETQNWVESRISPTADLVEQIHATPGYPITVSAGITLRFGNKK